MSNTDFVFLETNCKLVKHAGIANPTLDTLCRVEEGYKLHFMLDSDMEGAILTEISATVITPSYPTTTTTIKATIRNYYTKQ